MKKHFKKAAFGLFMLLSGISAKAQLTKVVNMSTGVDDVTGALLSNADDTWKAKAPGSSVYVPVYTIASTDPNAKPVSPYVYVGGPGEGPGGDYSYKMTFNFPSCNPSSAVIHMDVVGGDNQLTTLTVNGNSAHTINAGFSPYSYNVTVTLSPSEIVQGLNTIIINVHNNPDSYGLYTPISMLVDGNLTIDYATGVLYTTISGNSAVCAGDPITVDGSASSISSGVITDHVWTVHECDASGIINPSAPEWWSPYIPGAPGTYTIPDVASGGPDMQCGKYYLIKLALQDECDPWEQATMVTYVDCIPVFNILEAPGSACTGSNTTLSTDLSGTGYTYNWSIPGGPGSTSSTFTFPVTTSPQNVTLNVYSTGCFRTIPYTVAPNTIPICCQAADTTLVGGNLSAQIPAGMTSFGNILLDVTGTLVIDINNFSFNNTRLRMGANAQIVIGAGLTVNLNTAHLFACDYMWEGIELQQGSIFNASNSSIDDANIGIHVDATSMVLAPTINMSNNTMYKNYIGIEIQNYTNPSFSYPITFSNNTIAGNYSGPYTPGTVLKPYKRLWNGDIIYPASTEYGIYAQNVIQISIGLNSSNTNFFRALHTGIRSENSNTSVVGCGFYNLTPAPYNSIGIWAIGTSTGHVDQGSGYESKLNVGLSAGNKCTFSDLGMGVNTESCVSSDIEYNTFLDVWNQGVNITGCSYYRTVSPGVYTRNYAIVSNNSMSSLYNGMQNGISFFNNTSLVATAKNNSIALKPISGSTCEGVSVNNIYSPATTYYTIDGNTITKGFYNGITLNDAYHAIVQNNRIVPDNDFVHGIKIFGGSSNNYIYNNTIDASAKANYMNGIEGISLDSTKTDTLYCNYMIQNEHGIGSYLNCSVADIDGNTFNKCRYGIDLYYSVIGQQGSAGAGVTNNFIGCATGIYCDHSNGSLSPYYAYNLTGYSCVPTTGNSSGTNVHVTPVSHGRERPNDHSDCIKNRKELENDETGITNEPDTDQAITVYPNPSNGIITVETGSDATGTIEVFDVLGKKVISIIKTKDKSTYELDLSGAPKGIYLVKIIMDGKLTNKKVVIQ